MARSSGQNDTQQLLICNIRSTGTKRVFIVVGALCISLVILLFVWLNNSGPNQENNDRHKRSTQDVIYESGKFENYVENCDETDLLHREKRQASIDPVEVANRDRNVRRKRLSEHLHQVRAQFEQCRQTEMHPSEKCEKFYREMVAVNEALKEEIGTLGHIAQNFQTPRKSQPGLSYSNHKVSQWSDPIRKPFSEFNREGQAMQKVNDFTQFPRFHEEMDNLRSGQWSIDEPSNRQSDVPMPSPPPLNPRIQTQGANFRESEKISPLKTQTFDPSSQILSLCEQISRQNPQSDRPSINNLPGPTSSGFVTNNAQPQPHNFNQNFQQTQQVQQQFMPQMLTYRPNPVCIYPQAQTVQALPVPQSTFMPQTQFITPVANGAPVNRFVLVNQNPQQFASTSPSGQAFVPVVGQPAQRSEDADTDADQPSSCPAKQLKEKESTKAQPKPKSTQQPRQQPGPDSLYESFMSRLASVNVTNPFNTCDEGEKSCISSNQCILSDKWCDNVVDCLDSSDETSCSCSNRLNEDKICDGYLDCPLGTDEIGCFGCDKNSYSCFNSADEFQQSKASPDSMCYTLTQKCNGFHDCFNGKDEEDCSMLIKFVGTHTTFMVPYTEGILYRNFRGRWYPACEDPEEWAKEACESEMGPIFEPPQIQNRFGMLPGPFLSRISRDVTKPLANQLRFSESCPMNQMGRKNHYIQVKCPPMQCGIVRKSVFNAPKLRIRGENERKKRDEILRIVGGDRSGPHNWPYVVALYKDGRFHCGGTIINEQWIISAAHCASKASAHYYEVHAGLLRRFSYAPEVQVVKVVAVIVNNGFDRHEMLNDVSLLRLERPLSFNRWVKPICLPTAERVTSRYDPNWMEGPPPGTMCTVVGWGALAEGGSSPDNLEEVNLPIMKTCKTSMDIDGNEICAGEKDGGHDACQGDSGGPLICRSNLNPEEFYLAGIVSHGEGCARRGEPGVYTRVALYIDWIEDMINSDLSRTAITTRTKCPGFQCIWSSRCIANRYHCNGQVDCLGGEDELNCSYNPITSARKRVGRQNVDQDLPEGGGNSDIPRSDPKPLPATTETVPLQTTEKLDEIITTTEFVPLEPPTTEVRISPPTTVVPFETPVTEAPLVPLVTQVPFEPPTTEVPLILHTTEVPFVPPTTTTEAQKTTTSTEIPLTTTTTTTTTEPPKTTTTTTEVPTTTTTIEPLKTTTTTTEPPKTTTTTTEIPATTTTEVPLTTTTTEAPKTTTTTTKVPLTTSTTTTQPPRTTTTTEVPLTTTTQTEPPKTTTTTEPPKTPTELPMTTTDHDGILIPVINFQEKFICKNIKQTIDQALRCDLRKDCEDGTDEMDCECRDTLKGTPGYEHLVCNGVADCLDLSDEKNCSKCKDDEFECKISKQCIPKKSKCDSKSDCNSKEDELDCVALTDGKEVLLDADLRPNLRHKGILCENSQGVWSVRCVNRLQHRKNSELAGQTCTMLGFSGYSSHNVLMVDENGDPKRKPPAPKEKADFRQFGRHSWDRLGSPPHRYLFKRSIDSPPAEGNANRFTELVGAPRHQCFALYVECVPHSLIPIIVPDPNNIDETTTLPPVEITTQKKPQETSTHTSVETTTKDPIEITTEKPKPKPEEPKKPVKPIEPVIQIDDKPTIVVPFEPENDTITEVITNNFSAPWTASIFIDGELTCIGVLLGQNWVLVERSCVENVNLDEEVINVILGHSKNPPTLQTPSEQNIRVDCMKHFKNLKSATGLHLVNNVQFNRYTLPTYIPPSIDDDDRDCIAVSHGPNAGFVSIPVVRNDTDCPDDQKNCYQSTGPLDNVKCNGFDGSRYGVIVCRSDNNTYYPIALTSDEEGLCSLQEFAELELLEPNYRNLQILLTWPRCMYSKDLPKCDGFRCPLGQCIAKERVCDRTADCRDGSDEDEGLCKEKNKCLPDQLKCKDGSCVSKTKFCNKVADCPDKSDEPEGCTCFQYLELADPARICDGIPNCHDKSDEHSECPCRKDGFKCNNDICTIPQFVCDGTPDCPEGEDEKSCYAAEENYENNGYYRVIERSAGEWQTKCLKKPQIPTQKSLMEICNHLGYENSTNIEYHLLDPEREMDSKYGNSVKVIKPNMFSTVKLNEHFNLTGIQPSRKMSKTVPWNDIDNAACYQLEINCG